MSHTPTPQAPDSLRAHAARRFGAQDGFSVIEVIVAMLVVTLVLAAGVVAIAGSERVSRGATVMQQKTSVAQRALERAEGDLAQQNRCNSELWNKDTPPKFRTCEFTYDDMRDAQGRRYEARVRVTPVDDPADGVGRASSTGAGAGDSDFQSRDFYKADVTITIPDKTALAAIPEVQRKPYSMASRLDWSANENASLSVHVCSHYRMDRSVDVAGCGSGTHTGVKGITVTLTPVKTAANGAVKRTLTTDAKGFAQVANVLPAGDYRVTATSTSGFRFYRASPEFLKAEPGARHEVSVLMAQVPGKTRVCYRISNEDDGWGYWANATNFSWREDRSLVYRNGRMTTIDRSLRCQKTPLPDPLGYDKYLFQTDYAFAVQQLLDGSVSLHPKEDALRVTKVERDCTGSKATIGKGAGSNTTHLPTPWHGMYDQLGGDRTLCVYFDAYPIQSVDCGGPAPGCENRPTCQITYTGKATIPAGWDPCVPIWAESPPTGPFNPCPGGTTGPMQKTSPDPLGTYTGPVVANFGSGGTTYYGPGYECGFTANGERFDINKLTASTLTNHAWVHYGSGSCARVWSPRGEAIIKFNDTGGNPHALLDLSPGSTKGLGYNLGDNPHVSAQIVQANVPNGQGCSAWNLAGGSSDKCPVVQTHETGGCDQPYPPKVVDHWVKPEAKPGTANPKELPALGNSGGARRSL
jgi:type II secretory pathway pseudopilin PulG